MKTLQKTYTGKYAPNPLEFDYWIDLTTDAKGSVIKTYNGKEWTTVGGDASVDAELASKLDLKVDRTTFDTRMALINLTTDSLASAISTKAEYATVSELKTYVNNGLNSLNNTKANTADVYTKTEVDTKLEDYALKADIPTDYVTEAPIDGNLYARKDGQWTMILADTVNTITFNDNDASVKLATTGDTSWIKGKRCLVKTTDSGVAICYLDENNSNLFHDGVTEAKLDGTMGQFMTDIPEYWFSMDESVEGIHKLSLTNKEVDGWKKSRRVLLGVTEAVNVDGVLWSRVTGDEQSTGSLTSTIFHNYAVANGDGFDIIDYESHCKIAHLFYAKYANRNPQQMDQFGYGENSYTRTIGTTSTLGNNDGKTSTQISFLGIEDFYGGKYEWMSGIHSNGSVYYIYDGYEPDQVPTTEYRTVDIGGSYRYGYITKVYHGDNADMIPTEVSGSSTTHYADYGYVAGSGWRVVRRSSDSAHANGGVACFYAAGDSAGSSSYVGSRLLYRGDIQVIDNIEEFISM